MSQKPSVVLGLTVASSYGLISPAVIEMGRRGWKTRLVCSQSKWESASINPGLEVTNIQMTRGITPTRDARALKSWITLLRNERPDAVIGATPKAALLSMTAARLVGTRVRVLNLWGARWDGMAGCSGKLLRHLDGIAASSATNVISVSDSLADLFVREGVTRSRPTVIGAGGTKGVDLSLFTPDQERTPGMQLGYVGRLSEDKGIKDLLDVFDRCRLQLPGCRLLVLGAVDESQPIDKSTQMRLRSPGITWLGARRDVWSLMPEMDVLVFPSRREGLPNAVIEAAACGVPTVGYRVTGVKDSVIDGVTGRLVELGDVEALASAVLDVLGSSGLPMRISARDFAEQNFAEEDVADGYVNQLEEFIMT